MDTWVLLMNPGSTTANATVSFLLESGGVINKSFQLRPTSRFTIRANDFVQNGSFATKVESDQPVVVERAMYWDKGDSGHSSLGTTSSARTWFLAEGSTGEPFLEWLSYDPNSESTDVKVTFMFEGGGTVVKNYAVGPTSRFTLLANDEVPNKAVSARIDATRPIILERSCIQKMAEDTTA